LRVGLTDSEYVCGWIQGYWDSVGLELVFYILLLLVVEYMPVHVQISGVADLGIRVTTQSHEH
jgi:hypothetical protein